jgi:peptidoglycan/LPS O-acetylase OafA/YrhL
MATQLTDTQLPPLPVVDGVTPRPAGYLTMFDLFRVVVCASVVAQHSFLWTGMTNNVVGTAFITMLHYTRDAFFILSGVVVCYAQLTRPRSLGGFYLRRYVQIGVPYLVWTVLYVVLTVLSPGGGWHLAPSFFWSDLRYGYYQLYVVIVLFQFYALAPLLMKLLRSTRHHMAILAVSVALALFLGIEIHYNLPMGAFGRFVLRVGSGLPWGRNILSYQLYFVAGALVAFHMDEVLAFFQRHYRRVIVWGAFVGGVTLVWYLVSIGAGASTGSASDIYQPIAVLWAMAASAALFGVCWWWVQKRAAAEGVRTGVGGTGLGGSAASVVAAESAASAAAAVAAGSRESSWTRWTGWSGWWRQLRRPSIVYLAEITGGVFFSHVIFINLIRDALDTKFVGAAHIPWPFTVMILYVGTLACAVVFVSLVLRTPLRWVLAGPVRAEQRVRNNEEMAERAAHASGASGPSGPPRPEANGHSAGLDPVTLA